LTLVTAKLTSRMEGYAAKFAAETILAEPPTQWEPTDRNLAHVLYNCGRPPRMSEYAAIRDHFQRIYNQPVSA